MTTYTAALEHHVARLRQNPNNDYASGAVDALLSLLDEPTRLESLRKALIAGEVSAGVVRDPLPHDAYGEPTVDYYDEVRGDKGTCTACGHGNLEHDQGPNADECSLCPCTYARS